MKMKWLTNFVSFNEVMTKLVIVTHPSTSTNENIGTLDTVMNNALRI